MSIIIFIIILLILVLVHEFGHFMVAKKFGIKVEEFGIGFPPRAKTLFKKGETTYTLNWLPIGGFVKIFGENPDDESMFGPDSKRAMVNKPARVQAFVLVAGVLMNIILAWLLFSVGFMTGFPSDVSSAPPGVSVSNPHLVVTSVLKNSPAQMANLDSGDTITLLKAQNGDVLSDPNPETLHNFIISHGDGNIEFTVLAGKDSKTISITPAKLTPESDPAVGISMAQIGTLEKLSVPRALWEGLKFTGTSIASIAEGFAMLITGAHGTVSISDVSGPVGIVVLIGSIVKFGFGYLLSFTALISINLAVLNLIPFPALDGGRLLFLLIEKIKGSRINPKIGNLINSIGFALLILLMVVVTYHDVVRLF